MFAVKKLFAIRTFEDTIDKLIRMTRCGYDRTPIYYGSAYLAVGPAGIAVFGAGCVFIGQCVFGMNMR